MKILYATDIHGRTGCYETILERAVNDSADAIVNGGDLYPLGPELFDVQKKFLEHWLPDYLRRCNDRAITFLSTLGNMDLREMNVGDDAYLGLNIGGVIRFGPPTTNPFSSECPLSDPVYVKREPDTSGGKRQWTIESFSSTVICIYYQGDLGGYFYQPFKITITEM